MSKCSTGNTGNTGKGRWRRLSGISGISGSPFQTQGGLGNTMCPTDYAAPDADLNLWHRAIHEVTGDMALCFNKATAADLERWAKMLREVANEMDVTKSWLLTLMESKKPA